MEEFSQTAVIGGGMIGLSLCVLLTGNGIDTTLYVRNRPREKREQYEKIFKGLEEKKLLTKRERSNCESYLKITDSYGELEHAEIVFESVTEDLEAKREVYDSLFQFCPKLKAVASTTSAFSSLELAVCSKMKDKILVAHPFYPPHLIPCVEVVPNENTSGEALRAVTGLLRYLRREVVMIHRDKPGFVANRIQYAMLREAVHIVEEGIAAPEDVDRVLMYSFMPRYTSIGIFEHFDHCGLDLTGSICDYLYPHLSNASSVQKLLGEKCHEGEFGVKCGKGIYSWDEERIKELEARVEKPYLNHICWNIPKAPRKPEKGGNEKSV